MRELDVYLGERKAGVLAQGEDAALTFQYDGDYLAAAGQPISVSMPPAPAAYPDRITKPYFSGLLPDEDARRKLASGLGVSEGNIFGLLEIIGGECAGALSLQPPGAGPPPGDDDVIDMLDGPRLEAILERLRARPLLGGEDGVRLSLAGAQDKLAVYVDIGRIGLARGGRPTTHILKPFIASLEGTVENELFCMRLAARMRLDAPAVAMRRAGRTPFLLVERYDRRRNPDGTITRIHQEDFCQALSVPPELKYEAEGGPGIAQSLGLINACTARPAADRLGFLRMIVFHYLIGNADAHAKNFALLYRGRVPDLAPLYDALCTAAYPRLTKKLAMAIGGRSVPDTIQHEHWLTLVPQTRGGQRLLDATIGAMASVIQREADGLLQDLATEGIDHPILKTIRAIIDTRSRHLLGIISAA